MDNISKKIFYNKTVVPEKLIRYGFERKDGAYVYTTDICDGEMRLTVTAQERGDVTSEVYDAVTNEIYVLHLLDDAVGSFVGGVRSDCESVLCDIAEKCSVKEIFKSAASKKVMDYISDKYGDGLEFLWEKFDDNAVWRRKDTGKWYGVMIKVSKRKLGIDSDDVAEILDVRISPSKTADTIDNKNYFSAYHMNKKSWITVLMNDCSLPEEELFRRIDDSYVLAVK